MSNEAMIAGRFLRWAKARALVADIQRCLARGGCVVVATCTRATKFGPKHVGMFKATKSGAYMQRGRAWDCIDYCAVQFIWTR